MGELIWFVKMGMTPGEALKTCTLPNCWEGEESRQVTPRLFADIVAVDGDPLADVNVVVKNVHWE